MKTQYEIAYDAENLLDEVNLERVLPSFATKEEYESEKDLYHFELHDGKYIKFVDSMNFETAEGISKKTLEEAEGFTGFSGLYSLAMENLEYAFEQEEFEPYEFSKGIYSLYNEKDSGQGRSLILLDSFLTKFNKDCYLVVLNNGYCMAVKKEIALGDVDKALKKINPRIDTTNMLKVTL